jgi:hypothetical protein
VLFLKAFGIACGLVLGFFTAVTIVLWTLFWLGMFAFAALGS